MAPSHRELKRTRGMVGQNHGQADPQSKASTGSALTTVAEQPLHRALGLTDGELERICSLLERDPNDFELAVFSLLWSEHCGYKPRRRFSGAALRWRPCPAGTGRERRRGRPRGWTGCRVQGREPQPPVCCRAVPGSGRRASRGHPPRRRRDDALSTPFGRSLERLDSRRVVVALDLERDSLSRSPRSTTPAFSPGPCRTRSPSEGRRRRKRRRVLVPAVLAPEQGEDRELEVVRVALEQ